MKRLGIPLLHADTRRLPAMDTLDEALTDEVVRSLRRRSLPRACRVGRLPQLSKDAAAYPPGRSRGRPCPCSST